MKRCVLLAIQSVSPLQQFVSCEPLQHAAASLNAAAAHAAAAAAGDSSGTPEHAARLDSWRHCSTSSPAPSQPFPWGPAWTHVRGYAKAAKGKGAAKAAVAAVPAGEADPLAPPSFKVKRVPQVYKGDPIARLTGPQKELLQSLTPDQGPLRSLRQLNWDLGAEQTLALLHEQMSDMAGSNVQAVPLMLGSMMQSAQSLAQLVKEFVQDGASINRVEEHLLTAIASMPPSEVPFDGIKVQLKGRMSGKGGKASRKVWEWGRTGRQLADDPIGYAHEAVVTRAGYISIKVWVKYKRSHMAPPQHRIVRPAVGLQDLLHMPPITALPSRSSSAWWNRPVTWQPQQHQAWRCFKQGYDPLTGTWAKAAAAASAAEPDAE